MPNAATAGHEDRRIRGRGDRARALWLFRREVQPGFVFNNVPENAASLALLFHDIDVALDGSPEDGVHWTVWNIPPEEGGLPEGTLPPGAVAGRNVENRNAYRGPGAPPGSRYHHYVFELFALDRELDLPRTAGAPRSCCVRWRVTCSDKAAYVGRFRRERIN